MNTELEIEKIIKENLKTVLDARGITVAELASMAKISLPGMRSVIQRGSTTIKTLAKIAQCLQVPISQLISRGMVTEAPVVTDEQIVRAVIEKYGFESTRLKRVSGR